MNDETPADQVEDDESFLHQRDELEEDLTLCGLSWSGLPAVVGEPLPCTDCVRERQRRRGVGRYAAP